MKRIILFLLILTACRPQAKDAEQAAVLQSAGMDCTIHIDAAGVVTGNCSDVTPQPTETPSPTDTATPPPTETAVPTNTPTITPTATISPTVTPSPGQPCDHSDDTAWHGVIGPNGCHHDHYHGHDPNLANDVFGPPGVWHGGGELSGIYQTTAENQNKHQAYGWIVETDIPKPADADVWICDFRMQTHATSAPFRINEVLSGGLLGRVHSVSLEVQICDVTTEPMTTGINRTAGWYDFGCLFFENDTPVDPNPDDCSFFGPRRIHFDSEGGTACCPHFFWYGKNHPQAANPVQIAIASFDTAVDLTDISDPANPETEYICGDIHPYDCRFNDSTRQAHLIVLFPTPGMRTGEFYADRYGRLNESCTEISLDCLPNLIEYPLPFELQYRATGPGNGLFYEFDDCTPDWCIAYPD